MVQPAFPGARILSAERTVGGLANANWRLQLSNRRDPVRLRLFLRDHTALSRELAIWRTVRDRIPVPAILFADTEDPVTGHPFMFLEWITGVRLEAVIPSLHEGALVPIGERLGQVLAGIHGCRQFDRTGSLDARLQVVAPFDLGREGLRRWLRTCLVVGDGGHRLGEDLTHRLLTFVSRVGHLLDAEPEAPCLTHADFGPSNLLVSQSARGWELSAVLDWEFACSGTPSLDFGNLLRLPLGQKTGFAAAVATGYRAAGGHLPDNWLQRSRLVDLFAWAEMLSRPGVGPGLIADARTMLEDTMGRWETLA